MKRQQGTSARVVASESWSLTSADTDLPLPTPVFPPPAAGITNPANKKLSPTRLCTAPSEVLLEDNTGKLATQRALAQQVCGSRSPTRGWHTCSGVSGQPAAPLCGFFLLGSDTRSCRWAAPHRTCPWDNSLPGGFLVLQPGAALPPCSARSDATLNRRKNPEET